MKVLAFKLGCLDETEHIIYERGQVHNLKHYHLQPLEIERPGQGTSRVRVSCQACGEDLFFTVLSPIAAFRKRCNALVLSILPVALFAGFSMIPDNSGFWNGFALVICLSLAWMIPVFLPVVFRKEFLLAVSFNHKKEDRHRLFEPNVSKVTSEFYFKR